MKLIAQLSRLSIGQQVMLTALLPLLLLTFALSGYMISSRIQDAHQALNDEAETLMDYLTSAAEFGLLTQNVEVLEQLARGPIKRPDVTNIMFINAQSKLLYQSQARVLDFKRIIAGIQEHEAGQRIYLPGIEGGWMLVKPVLMGAVAVDDFDLSLAPERHLGAVVLILNDRALVQRQQQIILWGLLISATGLLLAAVLALRIGRNISAPIRALSHSLTRYQSGGDPPVIAATYQREIGALQQGITALIAQAQQHQQSLQRDVDQATAELQAALAELEQSHQTLQQSKERIEQSARAKDDFMARMSHELRTPISSVIGFIRLLEKSPLNDGQREYCRIILSASSLLLRLIDDILDFSKFQSDNLRLENIPFNPELCLEDVLEMQAPAAAHKGLTLALQCEAQWPLSLVGDPTRFSQVISNLISNAIKFTEQGGIQIRLSSQQQQGWTQLQIEIEDTGIGISAAELETLFQPFVQADTSISRRFGGSGLGLMISKRLVELMGGALTLSSEVGVGSLLSINLRLESAPPPPVIQLPELNVLLCCSDASCLARLEQQFRTWGCHVDVMDDRQRLVAQLQASALAYDRVLVRLTLAELKELSWTRFLSSVRESFTGELILLTEHGDDATGLDVGRLVESLAPATMLRLPVGRYRLLHALEAKPLPSRQASQPLLALQGVRVLVVEDNGFNRLLLTRMLEAQGALVETAANGRDAVAAVARSPVDLVIMDLHMPILGGAQACQQIRQLPSVAAQTPIVILTADVISNELELVASLGLQGVLYKPVDEAMLVKQVLAAYAHGKVRSVSDVAMRMQRFGIQEQELKQAFAEQFSALQRVLLSGNESALREQVHQFSGLVAMVGLDSLETQLRAIALAAKQKLMDEAWRLFRVMESDFDKSNSVCDDS
ncbi:MAG: ATP-binding protein [Motiliproteus sp.]